MCQPVVLTTSQSQIQEQLQRKHEELQRLIVQQQEELQRVSEQLLMARYGLLSPVQFDVTLPCTVAAGPAISSITSTLGSTHQHYQIQPGTSISLPVTTVSSEMSVHEHSSPAVTSVASHRPVQTTSIMIESHQVKWSVFLNITYISCLYILTYQALMFSVTLLCSCIYQVSIIFKLLSVMDSHCFIEL
jgi:hypothetical protein